MYDDKKRIDTRLETYSTNIPKKNYKKSHITLITNREPIHCTNR